MPWLQTCLELLREHWAKSLLVAPTLIPVLWGIYQARRQWKTREFMSRFSISLNMLRQQGEDAVLWLPAAEELQLEDVFHRNRTAVAIVRKAAYATTPEEPFLVTIPPEDCRSILNEVGNRVEVMFREGSFAVLAGLPVRYVNLVIGLTCEKGADVRIRKIPRWLPRKSCCATSTGLARPGWRSRITSSAARRCAGWPGCMPPSRTCSLASPSPCACRRSLPTVTNGSPLPAPKRGARLQRPRSHSRRAARR